MTVTARMMFTEELQARREGGGLTQEQLAQKASVSLSLLKKIEIGNRRPQRDFALWCDQFFGCPGTFERFHRLTLLETFPDWFASRVLLEEEATAITEWEMRGIPGLLQTQSYAEAIIRACRPFGPESVVLHEIDARMERQQVLKRDIPPKLWVLIAEGPLGQAVGGPAVMRAQLDHLIDMVDASKCVIQVLPRTAPDAPGANGPAVLFEFEDRTPVAHLEGWEMGEWLKIRTR